MTVDPGSARHENRGHRREAMEAAVEKELQARRRRLYVYWLLIVAAAVLGAIGLWQSDSLSQTFANSPEVAEAIAENPRVIASLGENPALAMSIGERILPAGEGEPSTAFGTRVSEMARSAALAYTPPIPADLIERLDGAADAASRAEATAQRAARSVDGLRGSLPAGIDPAFVERIEAIEKTQIETERESEAMRSNLEALTRDLAAARTETADSNRRNEQLLARLNALIGKSRSYVLKEGSTTGLPDLGWTVSIGRLRGEQLFDVSVFDAAGKSLLAPSLRTLGKPVELTSTNGSVYLATFTFVVNRLLAGELIGLELVEVEAASR